MMELDHIAVAGETRAEATEAVETALGVKMQPGGDHDVFFTHNTLLGLEDGLYLEAIAINPDAPTPDRPRWFDLDRFTGPPKLTNWICRSDDLATLLASLPAGAGTPVSLQRGDLRWDMAVPANGQLPFDNLHPAVIQWHSAPHPATRLAPSGCRLDRLIVAHPEATELGTILAPHLSDPRIVFEPGTHPALRAEIQTPHGLRVLQ